MRIRQIVWLAVICACPRVLPAQSAVPAEHGVVTLPGIQAHANADTPGCAEPVTAGAATGSTVSLSYACLNRAVAPGPTTPMPLPSDSDIRKRTSNQLGLYNAAAFGQRMGPNLGTSVQPYRPKLTYPTKPL